MALANVFAHVFALVFAIVFANIFEMPSATKGLQQGLLSKFKASTINFETKTLVFALKECRIVEHSLSAISLTAECCAALVFRR